MGLDMYLKAEKYHSEYFGDKKQIPALAANFPFCDKSSGFTVKATVKYWRKANAIHAWFVRELAEGKDDCQEIPVGREDIKKLLEEIKNTLAEKEYINADPGNISEYSNLIPTSGFFFGSTNVDEWFWQNLEETAPVLEKLLSKEWEDFEFSYRASW